jgi:acetyltransferase-like isoleucine patch superfamily enzyme
VSGSFVGSADITSVANGAFSGNLRITSVSLPGVTRVGNYAFAYCESLQTVELGRLTFIGDYAFYRTDLVAAPSFAGLSSIGAYAFAYTDITEVMIPAGMKVGNGAFRECKVISSVVIGDNAVIGKDAFRLDRESNFTAIPGNYRNEQGKLVYYYIYTSSLQSLTVGNGVVLGNGAFMGAAVLESVTLGTGVVIGDSAFYNTPKLKSIDLSKVLSIGAGAFSGDVLYEFADQNMTEPAIGQDREYLYRYYAPALTAIDLSAATYIGEDAFAYCRELASVKLGEGVSAIPARAFNLCVKLADIDLSGVKSVGDNAFCETVLTAVDLSSATSVDKYAFVYNKQLASVTFGADNVQLGEGAFAYCDQLSAIIGSNKLSDVGAYAFAYTALTAADLSGASAIGDGAFMKETMTPFAVTLGKELKTLGENPFAMCRLQRFESTVTEEFNGEIFTGITSTFDISETVKVINGMLYRVVPNGLEMISYAGDATTVVIADGTVRITALAFAGSDVVQVVLPSTLISIGHKAFYGCDQLTMVSFASYEAPALEEEYDYSYWLSAENLPATGDYQYQDSYTGETLIYKGLGIVPYFMWNATDTPSVIYYGANFSDYIGHIKNNIVMVKPSNGLYYDSFIYGQYFTLAVEGAVAADKTTLEAIAAIKGLPDTVTLADKALVEAARAAYDRISSDGQRQLVKENGVYDKLVKAENRIRDLEYIQNEQTPAPEAPPAEEPVEEGISGATVAIIVLSILLGLFVLATAAAVVLFVLWKKGIIKVKPSQKADHADEQSEESAEGAAEAVEESVESEEETTKTEEAETKTAEVEEEAPADKETTENGESVEEKANEKDDH